ncbi:MAG: 4-alpha-glucanotransferase [Acidimicrobiales bacterium]
MPDAWGVDDGYEDTHGQWHETPRATKRALRVAMGDLADRGDPPPPNQPVWFVRQGSAPAIERGAVLLLEDGTELEAADALPHDLPLGYHDLQPDGGAPNTRLIVTPDRCHPARRRMWGWSAQLYACRSEASWGMGDLADLRRLARWSGEHGAGVLAINPLHAALPVAHQEPSPYFPSSRRYRNPLYVRIEEAAGFDPSVPLLAEAAAAGRALNAVRSIDRDEVYRLKMAALSHIWAKRSRGGERGSVVASGADDRDVATYAVFCTLAEHHGCGWRGWPGEHRRPDNPGVQRFATEHAERVRFHGWIQELLDDQLARAAAEGAAAGVGLLGDLAVGVDPDGADAWRWQDTLAAGATVGAPPDTFNTAGQDWGLAPYVPWKLRAAAYEPFARTVRAAMRQLSALRIDHVMGLFRLFWLTDGASPDEGAYVRYRGTELLDIVALESARAGVTIVGEDLGTVEDDVRSVLHERAVLSFSVGWFEADPPEEWPAQSLATLTTHDLPTVAGLLSRTDAQDAMGAKLDALAPDATDAVGAAVAAYGRIGSAPSVFALATFEDALGVLERPNLPGTTTERPNWSLALPKSLSELEDDEGIMAVAEAIARTRRGADLG